MSAKLFILSCVVAVLAIGSAFAQQPKPERSELNDTVKWAIWHEGCRIYAADNSLGDVEEIRDCFVGVYQQNEEAQQALREAKASVLLGAIRTAAREIPGERQLNQYLEYAAKHEGLLQKFRELRDEKDIESIRTLYYETFKSNENARNLLAALSDEALSDLVGALE